MAVKARIAELMVSAPTTTASRSAALDRTVMWTLAFAVALIAERRPVVAEAVRMASAREVPPSAKDGACNLGPRSHRGNATASTVSVVCVLASAAFRLAAAVRAAAVVTGCALMAAAQ